MTKLGLCLSGGGSKGAYEIGVYRALRKLGKNPNIVTGTSIGAINGMLIVQGDLYKAVDLWKSISFDMIYDDDAFGDCDDMEIADIYKEYAKNFIAEGGMNVNKLVFLIKENYNAKKFFSSPIDYGLVTYNLTKHKPIFMKKNDLNDDNVADYVMASASCYPAFKPYKIGADNYVDGGYYDNLPINLAIEMGAEEIIAVDLRSVGFKRKTNYDVPVLVISPRNKINSFLVFDKEKAHEALRFGYNDAMKFFGKLDGDSFTFKKGNLVKNYNKYFSSFEKQLNCLFDNLDNKIVKNIINLPLIQDYLNNKNSYRNFNKMVETAGKCFNFAEDVLYNIKTYNKGLFNELLKVKAINKNTIAGKIKNRNLKNIIDSRGVVRFFYDAILHDKFNDAFVYVPLFIDEFLIALYIYIIKGRKKAY